MELSELQAQHEQVLSLVESLYVDGSARANTDVWPDWSWPEQHGMQWPNFDGPPGLNCNVPGVSSNVNAQFFHIGSPEPWGGNQQNAEEKFDLWGQTCHEVPAAEMAAEGGVKEGNAEQVVVRDSNIP